MEKCKKRNIEHCTKSKFCAKRSSTKYIFLQKSLYLALFSTFTYLLLYSYNVTLLLFKKNRLKLILMRLNFDLNYNHYINFKFQKFLIIIYIIIYKIFLKYLEPLYINIWQNLRQQTICLKNKNGLKSILVRRFLALFRVFLNVYKNQHFYKF